MDDVSLPKDDIPFSLTLKAKFRTSCNDFFSIRIKECNRSCVLVSDGLATFKFLSRMIKSNCKSLRKYEIEFTSKGTSSTVFLDQLNPQSFALIRVILPETSRFYDDHHEEENNKLVYEKNTSIDVDVESDLSLILIQYSPLLFDHPTQSQNSISPSRFLRQTL